MIHSIAAGHRLPHGKESREEQGRCRKSTDKGRVGKRLGRSRIDQAGRGRGDHHTAADGRTSLQVASLVGRSLIGLGSGGLSGSSVDSASATLL